MHDAFEAALRVGHPGDARSEGTTSKVVITFSEIISALSFAIDLTEDAVPGHALRSCLLGMRLGRALGMTARELESLYYALLLKDIGCSSNASRFLQIVRGEGRLLKGAGAEDPRRAPQVGPRPVLKLVRKEMRSDPPSRKRFHRILHMGARRRESDQERILLHCERGASITRKLGLSAATCDAVFALDERWDGSGSPRHLRGAAIPLLARLVSVAEHLDAWACERSPAAALAVLRERSGEWFDPELVEVAATLDASGELWTECLPTDDLDVTRRLVIDLDPKAGEGVGAEKIDRICEAFAEVVDAKSPFTYRHSVGVAKVAVAIAAALSLPTDRLRLVHRAALLHDLGKLSVPSVVLEKNEPLTENEWSAVMEHPRLTQQILARIEPFAEIAEIAGAHHEKLDGSGYPNGLHGHELGVESRVIAVADTYRAMTEGRPYRPGVSHAVAMGRLRALIPEKLDGRCVEALDLCCDPAREALTGLPEISAMRRKGPSSEGLAGVYQAWTA